MSHGAADPCNALLCTRRVASLCISVVHRAYDVDMNEHSSVAIKNWQYLVEATRTFAIGVTNAEALPTRARATQTDFMVEMLRCGAVTGTRGGCWSTRYSACLYCVNRFV